MFRLCLLLVLLVSEAHALPIRARAVPLHTSDQTVRKTGRLTFLAGFELEADDPRFGGISGFELTPDGTTLVAVSDRGLWITLGLSHDGTGVLVGVTQATIHALLGDRGQTLDKRWGDAEEVTLLRDGTLVVSFEHEHRLSRYPGVSQLGTAHETRWTTPPGLARAPANGGIEAMTAWGEGVLALREKPHDASGAFMGWVLGTPRDSKTAPGTFTYVTVDGFQPTGLARLPGGDALVLERRFSMLTGIAARIVRVASSSLVPGATVRTREIGRFGGEITCDNYEALAARPLKAGRVAVYVGSDDNYNRPSQRTLLMQLAYLE